MQKEKENKPVRVTYFNIIQMNLKKSLKRRLKSRVFLHEPVKSDSNYLILIQSNLLPLIRICISIERNKNELYTPNVELIL